MIRTIRLEFALASMACLGAATGCGSGSDAATPQFVEDVEWLALVDSDDAGSTSHDDEPRLVRVSDYGAASRPGTKLIMLVAATGWCAPCQAEASALGSFAAEYEPKGVAILTAVIEDAESNPADLEFAKLWAETFALTIPTLIDSEFVTRKYIDISAMPSTLIIAADTLEVLAVTVGADTGSDPLGKYGELLDFHLARL